jgi:hypothetical protein
MFWIGLESLALCCWFGRCSVVCFFLESPFIPDTKHEFPSSNFQWYK